MYWLLTCIATVLGDEHRGNPVHPVFLAVVQDRCHGVRLSCCEQSHCPLLPAVISDRFMCPGHRDQTRLKVAWPEW